MIYIYDNILIIKLKFMINIHRVLLSCILVTLVVGLRQSDIGNNDWSRENIGKLTEFRLPSFNGTTE